MKNLIKLSLAAFLFLSLMSCRRATETPVDINANEEISKMTLSIKEVGNATNAQTISYVGGNADKKIRLQNGKSYEVALDFFTKNKNNVEESLLEEIEKEKDEHFVVFAFTGNSVTLTRNADDIKRKDGNLLGIRTTWKVNADPLATKVQIQLNHAASSVDDKKPSATNQLGIANGGSADVNATIGIE